MSSITESKMMIMQDVQIIFDLMLFGHVGLFLACLAINLIPFISPSNMVLAGVAALILPWMSWIEIGVIVAIAATLSKVILYYTMKGSRRVMSEKMLRSIDYERERVEKWGAFALLISAASPVPDDPIVIYTGLTDYSISKFTLSYFLGKVAVTLAGAFAGFVVGSLFESIPIVIGSIVLTAIITGIIYKRRTEIDDSEDDFVVSDLELDDDHP